MENAMGNTGTYGINSNEISPRKIHPQFLTVPVISTHSILYIITCHVAVSAQRVTQQSNYLAYVYIHLIYLLFRSLHAVNLFLRKVTSLNFHITDIQLCFLPLKFSNLSLIEGFLCIYLLTIFNLIVTII